MREKRTEGSPPFKIFMLTPGDTQPRTLTKHMHAHWHTQSETTRHVEKP